MSDKLRECINSVFEARFMASNTAAIYRSSKENMIDNIMSIIESIEHNTVKQGEKSDKLREALLKIRKYRRDITIPDHESDVIYNLANDALNAGSQPKHETVEQWEKRTGETYPDDVDKNNVRIVNYHKE